MNFVLQIINAIFLISLIKLTNWYFLFFWKWCRQRTHSDRIKRIRVKFCRFSCHVLFWYQEILNLSSTVFCIFIRMEFQNIIVAIYWTPIATDFKIPLEREEWGGQFILKHETTLNIGIFKSLLFSISTEEVFKIF